jgi:L-lactate utilization protein LutB
MGAITPFSAINLIPDAKVDPNRWNRIPAEEIVAQTAKEIGKHGISVIRATSSEEAVVAIQDLIPSGAEVMNGASTTLTEIGYDRLLQSGRVDWIDLHNVITAENDSVRRIELRRKAVTADYFISGVNAIAQTSEIVSCDRTGSRVGAWPFGAGHLILVSGINKIVPTLSDALQRVWEYVLPLEDARSKKVYGVGSRIGKCVIFVNEEIEGRTFLILIDENLGY